MKTQAQLASNSKIILELRNASKELKGLGNVQALQALQIVWSELPETLSSDQHKLLVAVKNKLSIKS